MNPMSRFTNKSARKERLEGNDSNDLPFQAGAAEGVITPPAEGTFLIGPMASSTGVHDDLWARVLVLDDGATRVALVTMDYLGFDFAFNDVLVEAVSAASGIPSQQIMLNCSHTHNAPLTIPWGPWENAKDKEFHKTLPATLAELTRRACENLQPATIRYLRTSAQVGFNRRLPTEDGVIMQDNRDGVTLPWVDVLQVKSDRKTPVAVLVSHAAHPVIVHAASTLISADYPGFAMAALRELQGADCVYMFAQGCGSNINGYPLQGGFKAAQDAGRQVAEAVDRALTTAETDGCLLRGPIRVYSHNLAVSLAPPPSVEDCDRWLGSENDPVRIEMLHELRSMARDDKPRTREMRIRGFAFGDQFCLLGLSHEVFAEYAKFIEANSPFPNNIVLGYTNGVECYVGTEKDYRLGEQGGYETSPTGSALLYAGGLPLAPQAEKQIQDGMIHVLKKLSK